uniref:Uncharacterized protein n=1 Tax=Tanacetum cinerariifolium TaxID=118510 RepID=A0A699IY73_TANCI|nr:hypothetical protein [Tanacetum cinerariifolium]
MNNSIQDSCGYVLGYVFSVNELRQQGLSSGLVSGQYGNCMGVDDVCGRPVILDFGNSEVHSMSCQTSGGPCSFGTDIGQGHMVLDLENSASGSVWSQGESSSIRFVEKERGVGVGFLLHMNCRAINLLSKDSIPQAHIVKVPSRTVGQKRKL